MDTNKEYKSMLNKIEGLIGEYGADFGGIDPEAKEARTLITSLAHDKIVLPDKPVDFAAVNKDLYFKGMQLPDWLDDGIKSGYKFFYMRFPLGIQSSLRFNTINFRMEFQQDEGGTERPFFYNFFPNDAVKKYVEGNVSGKVAIDADFNFKPIPENNIGNVDASGEGAFSVKFNFPFSFGKTEITASAHGMNYAEWTFTAKDMKNKLENFAAIVKVPEQAQMLTIKLNTSGKRNTKNSTWLPGFLAKWIEILHARGDDEVKEFIKQGLPYTSPDIYWKFNLTAIK